MQTVKHIPSLTGLYRFDSGLRANKQSGIYPGGTRPMATSVLHPHPPIMPTRRRQHLLHQDVVVVEKHLRSERGDSASCRQLIRIEACNPATHQVGPHIKLGNACSLIVPSSEGTLLSSCRNVARAVGVPGQRMTVSQMHSPVAMLVDKYPEIV